jgi:acyl carrier protein
MRDKVVKILNGIRPEFDFNIETNFVDNGILDSFDIVSLVTSLDEEFNISIDGLDIIPDNFGGVDKIVDLLKKNGVVE